MAVKHYDAVFIGNGLISLSAAALLAKAGRSVLLLDPGQKKTQGISPGLASFSEGPLLYFGYETGGAMEGFFSKLSYPIPSLQQQGLRFKRSSPVLQTVQTQHRLSLYSERDTMFDELEREYGSEIAPLHRLFDQIEKEASSCYAQVAQFPQLEPAGMGERLHEWKRRLDIGKAISNQRRQKASDYLGQFAFSPELRKYFEMLSLFAFERKLADISVFDLIMLLFGLSKGGAQMMGGWASLVAFFQRRIEEQGGEILRGKAILEIEQSGKQITGLRLSEGMALSGRYFVLTQESAPVKLGFSFSLPKALVPAPMKELLLLAWGEARPPFLENLIVLRLNHVGDEDFRPDRRLMAATLLFRPGIVPREAHCREVSKKLKERLQWLIPFSQGKIEEADAPPLPSKEEPASALAQFLRLSPQGLLRGALKKVDKEALSYLQPRGEKNVFIVESDRCRYVSWGPDFLAGAQLADHLISSQSY